MTMPGRGGKLESSYRYGYQGSEINQETHNNSNQYTTEFRQLDARFGRWFSPDPAFLPHQSPYNSMDGNPINLTDVLGDRVYTSTGTDENGKSYGEYTGVDGTIYRDYWNGSGDYIGTSIMKANGEWSEMAWDLSFAVPVEMKPIYIKRKQQMANADAKKEYESKLQAYRDAKKAVEDFRDEGNSWFAKMDEAINDYLKSVPEGEYWDALKELEESLFPSGYNFYVTNGGGELGQQRQGDKHTEFKDITGLLEYFEAMAPKRPKFKGKKGSKLGKAYDKAMEFKAKLQKAVDDAQEKLDDLKKFNDEHHVVERIDDAIEYNLEKYDEAQMKEIVKKNDYIIKDENGNDSAKYSYYKGVLTEGLRLDIVDKNGDTTYSEILAPPPTR